MSLSNSNLETLSDRLRKNTLTYKEEEEINKPDFLITTTNTTTPTSSSSSSGSLQPRKSTSEIPLNDKSHSGELLQDSSSSSKRGHSRSHSTGSHNFLPTGNICPSGRTFRTGMSSRSSSTSTKTDVLSSGSNVNYGHGSIIRGGGNGIVSSDCPPISSRKVVMGNDGEELKRMGNECYKKGHFVEALRFYDKAIGIVPGNAAYRFNRAAALMGLRKFGEAVKECREAVRLEPGYVKAHHRLGSLLLSLGQVVDARNHICFPGIQPDPVELQKLQSVEKHLSKCTDARRAGDWRSTLRELDHAVASGADASPQLCASRAEALLKLHQLDEAFLAMSNVPKSEPASIGPHSSSKIFGIVFEAYIFFVRAQIELSAGRFDSALTAIERAGQLDPHNAEISILLNNVRLVCRARARGNDLFKSERFTEASSAYGEGLRLDPSNSVLYCNRAACWFKLGRWEQSVDDCNQALRVQPSYIKALLRRAASNTKLERWSEAVRDYEVLRKKLPDDNEVAESLFHAQVALKKSRGEEVYNMTFGGEVELVSSLEQFRAAISSTGVSVVHFEAGSNIQCKQISPFLQALCTRYPSINFLKVDIDESTAIARAESVKIVPTFKIYKKSIRVKEMVCPSPEVLESSVRHYGI